MHLQTPKSTKMLLRVPSLTPEGPKEIDGKSSSLAAPPDERLCCVYRKSFSLKSERVFNAQSYS
jgi:hypothetical protein